MLSIGFNILISPVVYVCSESFSVATAFNLIVPVFTGVIVAVAVFLDTSTSPFINALPVKLPSSILVTTDNLILSPLTFTGNNVLVALKSCPKTTALGVEILTP